MLHIYKFISIQNSFYLIQLTSKSSYFWCDNFKNDKFKVKNFVLSLVIPEIQDQSGDFAVP